MPNLHLIWGTIDGDVTVRQVGQDKKVAEVRVHDGKTWITIIGWEGVAEKIAPLTKGTYVVVSGRQQTRSYEKTPGDASTKRYVTETIVSNIDVVGASAPADDDLGIPD